MQTSWFVKISGVEAEKIMGKKLDKRHAYYKKTDEGKATDNPYAYPGNNGVFVYDTWLDTCSGRVTKYIHDYFTRAYRPHGDDGNSAELLSAMTRVIAIAKMCRVDESAGGNYRGANESNMRAIWKAEELIEEYKSAIANAEKAGRG